MEASKNPYKAGGPCYIAWEMGYLASLDDIRKAEENEEPTDQHGRDPSTARA